MEQGQFIELLSDLVKIGEAQDNRLTKEEISRYFADLDLAEEQMELLYQYLAANKILVEGAVMPARQEAVSYTHLGSEGDRCAAGVDEGKAAAGIQNHCGIRDKDHRK